ncbi:hypothetical protein ACFL6Y_00555 [Elusimicrobiota bacterium]
MSKIEYEDVRKELSKWKWFMFNQKYRFDLGHQFMVFLNFSLLVIAASDKLRYYTGVSRTWILLLSAIPFAFAGVWLFGLFLDKVVKYGQAYNIESIKRNPNWQEHVDQMNRIEQDLVLIREKLTQAT